MLSATSTRVFGASKLETTIFLERRLRGHIVRRDRLLYDSAFAPDPWHDEWLAAADPAAPRPLTNLHVRRTHLPVHR